MAIQRLSNVNFDKWDALRGAIDQLISEGIYKRLVEIHAAMGEDPDGFGYSLYMMHGSGAGPLGYRRFLPWHRAYLIIFERELRKIDPSLSIPYWDWNVDNGELIGFSDLMGMAKKRSTEDEREEEFFTSPEQIRRILRQEKYYRFTRYLELGPHNRGHGWLGGPDGEMNSMRSPMDAAFWFHHAQVDRIWAQWQRKIPNQKPFLAGRDVYLDPWETEFTVDKVNDITQLDNDSYEYV